MDSEKTSMASRVAAVIALVIFAGVWGAEAVYDGWYGAGIGWLLGLVMASLGFVVAWLALGASPGLDRRPLAVADRNIAGEFAVANRTKSIVASS